MNALADHLINSRPGRALAGWAASRLPSRPVILLYHGVSVGPAPGTLRNCEQKHIPLDAFVEHLRTLKRWRRVVSLQELIEGLRQGEDMAKTVAITFDDGYENNVLMAAPALADFGMTAAFFIATGFVGTDRWIWTDQLEMILDRTSCRELRAPIDEIVLPLATRDDRRAALKHIKARLKRLSHRQCLAAVANLGEQLDVDAARIATDGDYRFMHWDQARALAAAGFEVGAHTVNHPILSRIPEEEAKAEILQSRDRIAMELGACSPTFCYPNGKSSDYTPELARFCGQHFRSAVSANRGHAAADEMFELKRFGTPSGARVANIEWMLLRER